MKLIRDAACAHNGQGLAFVTLLRDCAKRKDLYTGIKLHDDILEKGLVEECLDALVTMYAKCGALAKANKLLDMHKSRDVYSWTALISGYAQKGQGQNALNCFEQMQSLGLSPDAVTFSCILKACGSIGAAEKGKQIHDKIAKQGLLNSSAVLGTSLVDMYAKCGALTKARCVLQELPSRSVASWNALIAGFVQHGQATEALNCFEQMQGQGHFPDAVTFSCILRACGSIKAGVKGEEIHDAIARAGLLNNNAVLGSALVDMYAKCGAFMKAQQVLKELTSRNVACWNSLIAGYAQQDQADQALACFEKMQSEGLSPNTVTFASVLKACGSIKAVEKGQKIHDEIALQGLMQKDIVLATAVVDMYAKCGALSKAQQVLEGLPSRSVTSWNALITGYVQQGQGEQALSCFECMRHEGLSPDAVTYACILKACGSISAREKGECLHDEISKQGLLRSNIVLGSALVDMYVKCGALGRAQKVLRMLPVRNVVSWSAMIAGYAEKGEGEQALKCFEQMKAEGISPNRVTYASILKACGSIQASEKGERIHDELLRQGLLCGDAMLGTALVDMYAKCGALAKARKVLKELPIRDAVSWSSLISGYAQQGEREEVMNCIEQMQREGFLPNTETFCCILKACGSIGAADKGAQIHAEIARLRLLGNGHVFGTALVDMYAKCGALVKARYLLEELSSRDVHVWNALITGYCQQGQDEQALKSFEKMQADGITPDTTTFACILKACGSVRDGIKGQQIHDEIAKQGLIIDDVVLGPALVDMYVNCDFIVKAERVLEDLPIRNVVIWNALIAGYSQQGQDDQALDCFGRMQREGLSPNTTTFTCILKACGSIRAANMGAQVHDDIRRRGLLGNNVVLGTALVDMYSKCGALQKAEDVLVELSSRSVPTWNALISGYVQQGDGENILRCFDEMQHEHHVPDAITFASVLKGCGTIRAANKGLQIHIEIARRGLLEDDIVLGIMLVDMYAKCGAMARAEEVHQELPALDVVSWSVLITGYVQQGQDVQALDCFEQMQEEGLSPNAATLACILKACGTIGAADKGKQIHDEIAKQGLLGNDVVLGTALVDMYAKCGAFSKAEQVLKELPCLEVSSWNALIAGYTQRDQNEQALACYVQMQREGIAPNAVTFSCILKACGGVGAPEKGEEIHDEIVRNGFLSRNNPLLETALVDMYAKCGYLIKAHRLLEDLFSQDVTSWNALITGYAQQGEGSKALNCFEQMQLMSISPNAVTLLCVLNVCSHLGLVDDGQQYFQNMSREYDVKPDIEHFTCMVDLFGQAGLLDKAVGVIEKMRSSEHSVIWGALLGACQKWCDVSLGKWAFEHGVKVDESDASFYLLMTNIYSDAGMQEEADHIEALRHEKECTGRMLGEESLG